MVNVDYFINFGDFISSYKTHSLFAIFLALLFFPNPISIAMVIIGANLPDLDHNIKKINIYKMEIIGLICFITLYIAELPYFIGIILCILPIIFYFSNHRGFTHSLLGIIILSSLIFLVVLMGVAILSPFLSSFGLVNVKIDFIIKIIPISLIIIILAILTLNKKLIVPFVILFLLGVLFLPEGISIYNTNFYNIPFCYDFFEIISSTIPISSIGVMKFTIDYNYSVMIIFIFFPIFLGFLSHLILDSLTPAGIELFNPFSSRKFHKNFAFICFIILFVLIILGYLILFY